MRGRGPLSESPRRSPGAPRGARSRRPTRGPDPASMRLCSRRRIASSTASSPSGERSPATVAVGASRRAIASRSAWSSSSNVMSRSPSASNSSFTRSTNSGVSSARARSAAIPSASRFTVVDRRDSGQLPEREAQQRRRRDQWSGTQVTTPCHDFLMLTGRAGGPEDAAGVPAEAPNAGLALVEGRRQVDVARHRVGPRTSRGLERVALANAVRQILVEEARVGELPQGACVLEHAVPVAIHGVEGRLGGADLAEGCRRHGGVARGAQVLHRRQKHSDELREDRDDDDQLDEREPPLAIPAATRTRVQDVAHSCLQAGDHTLGGRAGEVSLVTGVCLAGEHLRDEVQPDGRRRDLRGVPPPLPRAPRVQRRAAAVLAAHPPREPAAHRGRRLRDRGDHRSAGEVEPAGDPAAGDRIHARPRAVAGLHRRARHRRPGRDARRHGRPRRRPEPDQPAAAGGAGGRPLRPGGRVREHGRVRDQPASWTTAATASGTRCSAGPSAPLPTWGWCRRTRASSTR